MGPEKLLGTTSPLTHAWRQKGEIRLTSFVSKLLLTPDEFRDALGGAIGRGSIYELVRAGRIRSVRLGRKILIPITEVNAFIEREAGEAGVAA